MSGICKFTGEKLEGECPNVDAYGGMVGQNQTLAIQFEDNTCHNMIRGRNLAAAYGNLADSIRLLDGPVRINGDLLVEGDIIGQAQFKCYGDTDNDGPGFDFSLFLEMQEKLEKMERIMEYLAKRFVINLEDIEEEIEGLAKRSNASKRLDAID